MRRLMPVSCLFVKYKAAFTTLLAEYAVATLDVENSIKPKLLFLHLRFCADKTKTYLCLWLERCYLDFVRCEQSHASCFYVSSETKWLQTDVLNVLLTSLLPNPWKLQCTINSNWSLKYHINIIKRYYH